MVIFNLKYFSVNLPFVLPVDIIFNEIDTNDLKQNDSLGHFI